MKLRIAILSLMAASLFMVACGGGDASVRDEAKKAIQANPTPAAPVTPTAAPATPATPAAPAGPTTTLSFDNLEYDYGTITSGEKVQYAYKFKNTGSEPLIISNAKGSCGCTVPEWPKEPIAPGASSEILVQFDSSNKSGNQSKRVTLTSNTNPAQTFLTIKGIVNKAEEAK
ncbi:MAG: DUF1573 domain-containing protein [Saprospiraceae bacterium]